MGSVFFIAHPRAWKGTLNAVKKKGISCFETDKKKGFFKWMSSKWHGNILIPE